MDKVDFFFLSWKHQRSLLFCSPSVVTRDSNTISERMKDEGTRNLSGKLN